jgi:hypothetical protein
VRTTNAEDNTGMCAVNAALGFVSVLVQTTTVLTL